MNLGQLNHQTAKFAADNYGQPTDNNVDRLMLGTEKSDNDKTKKTVRIQDDRTSQNSFNQFPTNNRRKSRGTRNIRKQRHKMIGKNVSVLSEQCNHMDKRWNVFRSIPRERDVFDPRWTIIAAQIFKVLIYLVLYCVVLCAGLTSKMIMLLMAAHIRDDILYIECKPYGEGSSFIPQYPAKRLPVESVTWFYWCLWTAICIPEVLIFLRSVRMVLFRYVPNPGMNVFFVAFITETVKTIGVGMLVFMSLCQLDSVRGAMLCSSLATFPAVLSVFSCFSPGVSPNVYILFADIIALCLQVTGTWIWPLFDGDLRAPINISLALLFISFGWWENFVGKTSPFALFAWFGKVKERMQASRYKSEMVLSVWRCILSFFIMWAGATEKHGTKILFDFGHPLMNQTLITDEHELEKNLYSLEVLKLSFALIFSSFICYMAAKYACRVRMEGFSYAFPVALITPLTVAILISFCEAKKNRPCYFHGWLLSERLFWSCDYGDHLIDDLFNVKIAWAWLMWFISFLWINSHVFTQKPPRLAQTDTLFVRPMYDGLFIGESLMMNRRRNNVSRFTGKEEGEESNGDDVDMMSGRGSATVSTSHSDCLTAMSSIGMSNAHYDKVTKIYVCGTMWHETRREMIQVLSSILRMDEDQSARRNAQQYFGVKDPDYYEMEAHIFFDDAWVEDNKSGNRVPNSYVEALVSVMNEAAASVHKINIELSPPMLINVPYGGRLVFTMPGENKLCIHLKDKTKIRHKKRWSQVMYMYYLLGHRIMECVSDVTRKQVIADNTYILAIDGDSNFSPSAVQKLVDLMKKESRCGSACGRIHPIGTGIMVWYQKFEYAIAHWFQKATEHVLGCVLCSPGAFSLFRGSALMDDNIMHKYTKVATEPDILFSMIKKAVVNNDSISRPYIFYQMMVILFSLLGPAIIFTMMVFAQAAAFRRASGPLIWYNLIPVTVFSLSCFILSSKAQLFLAKIISVGYSFVMMAVLIGTGIGISEEGLATPTSIFVLSLAGIFCAAAFFHPQEFSNIFYGFVFFLMIPCTYVILSLYSLINLNVINWGTREAAAKATGQADQTVFHKWLKKIPFIKKSEYETSEGGDAVKDVNLCNSCTKDSSHVYEERLYWVGQSLQRIEQKLDDRKNAGNQRQLIYQPLAPKLSSGGHSYNRSTRKLSSTQKDVDSEDIIPKIAITKPTPSTSGFKSRQKVGQPTSSILLQTMPKDGGINGGECGSGMTTSTPRSGPILSTTDQVHQIVSPTSDLTSHGCEQPQNEPKKISSCSATLPDHQSVPPPERGKQTLAPSDGSDSSFRRDGDEDASSEWDDSDVPGAGHTSMIDESGGDWMKLPYLRHGVPDVLEEVEHQFWTDLIQEYLKPLKKDVEKDAQSAEELAGLRNSIAFGLILVNSLLILIIYLLQDFKTQLSIKIGFVGNHSTFMGLDEDGEEMVDEKPLLIEPIGFSIIFCLLLILIVSLLHLVL